VWDEMLFCNIFVELEYSSAAMRGVILYDVVLKKNIISSDW
jgi:hypothetical protein